MKSSKYWEIIHKELPEYCPTSLPKFSVDAVYHGPFDSEEEARSAVHAVEVNLIDDLRKQLKRFGALCDPSTPSGFSIYPIDFYGRIARVTDDQIDYIIDVEAAIKALEYETPVEDAEENYLLVLDQFDSPRQITLKIVFSESACVFSLSDRTTGGSLDNQKAAPIAAAPGEKSKYWIQVDDINGYEFLINPINDLEEYNLVLIA